MKYLQSILIIIFFVTSLNAQNSRNYIFKFDATDTTKNFSLDLPENWQITTETVGTPYAIIGFELSNAETYNLNKCAPEMKIGIKIVNLNLDKCIEVIGLFHKGEGNVYLFKDTDDFVNIIFAEKVIMDNFDCMVFTINILSDCPTTEIKKTRKKKRATTPKTYVLLSHKSTTICIESFNNTLDEKIINSLKSSFKINN